MQSPPLTDAEAQAQYSDIERALHDIAAKKLSAHALIREINDIIFDFVDLEANCINSRVSPQIIKTVTARISQAKKSLAALQDNLDAAIKREVATTYGDPIRPDPIKTNLGNVTFRPYLPHPDRPIVALKESSLAPRNDMKENPVAESTMLQIVRTDRHHGVLRWVRSHSSMSTFYCSTEFVSTGDLFIFLTGPRRNAPGVNTIAIFRTICHALDYLHNGLFIAHRDLKPENILVAEDLSIRICDFGVAVPVEPISPDESPENAVNPLVGECLLRFSAANKLLSLPYDVVSEELPEYPSIPVPNALVNHLNSTRAASGLPPVAAADVRIGDVYSSDQISAALHDASSVRVWAMEDNVGTTSYMAPEVMASRPYNPFCADIYSMGVLLFIMITSFPPYKARHERAYTELKSGGVAHLLSLYGALNRVPLPMVKLMEGMMSFDEATRPSIKQVLKQLDDYLAV